MSEQLPQRLSRREAADLSGLSLSSLRYHLQTGTLRAGADGRLSRSDVEALRDSRRVDAVQDERSAALLKARVLGGAVKLKNLRLSVAALQARTVERATVEAAMDELTVAVLAMIKSWPDRHAERIAAELDVTAGGGAGAARGIRRPCPCGAGRHSLKAMSSVRTGSFRHASEVPLVAENCRWQALHLNSRRHR